MSDAGDAALPERLDPARHAWMRAPEVRAVWDALAGPGDASVRFVGGCVRDALAGQDVADVDLATDLRPEAVAERLDAAGLRAVPTGVEHGTVTAVVSGRGFEVTTLRRDVETDGRRAVVEYTHDWREDAARRDFTMNALSAEADGTLHDYFGGRADLAAGRVRFVGEADTRIREDVLRILRFCRFHARFGADAPAGPDFEACVARRDLLPQLSAERVHNELSRLLAADRPVLTVEAMVARGLLEHWLPEARDTAALAALVTHERATGRRDWLRRLAALAPPSDGGQARRIAERLRLSNAEADRLRALSAPPERFEPGLDRAARDRALHRLGADLAWDLATLGRARAEARGESEAVDAWETLIDAAAAWTPKDLPVSGADVLALGVPSGPAVGDLLRALEDWWIAQGFAPDRSACLAELERLAAARARAGSD